MRSTKAHHAGFTLIEVLIVVMIMAVLAGTVITYSSNCATDAKESALKHNLYVLNSQIELYKADHIGRCPVIKDNALPQMNRATNRSGDIGLSGPAYPFGPYFVEVPTNPYDGSSHVAAVATPGKKPTAVADKFGGWQYDAKDGSIWPNNPESYRGLLTSRPNL